MRIKSVVASFARKYCPWCLISFFFWNCIRVLITFSLLGGGIPTQNRGYRDNRLCTSIVLFYYCSIPYLQFWSGVSSCAAPIRIYPPFRPTPPPLPPPPRNPSSRPLNRLFTEVQNRSYHNILCDRILPRYDLYLDLLKPPFLHRCRQRRIFPSTLPPPPRMPPCDPSHNPVLKSAQGPLHPGIQDPRLFPEKQHRLSDRLKEQPRELWFSPLTNQDCRHSHTDLPSLPQVACHCQTVIILCCQHPSQIFEQCYGLQRFPVGLEGPPLTIPQLFLCQPFAFTFRSVGALGGGKVPPVQCMPRHHNVASGHCGWGRFPSSKIMTISWTCQ